MRMKPMTSILASAIHRLANVTIRLQVGVDHLRLMFGGGKVNCFSLKWCGRKSNHWKLSAGWKCEVCDSNRNEGYRYLLPVWAVSYPLFFRHFVRLIFIFLPNEIVSAVRDHLVRSINLAIPVIFPRSWLLTRVDVECAPLTSLVTVNLFQESVHTAMIIQIPSKSATVFFWSPSPLHVMFRKVVPCEKCCTENTSLVIRNGTCY